MGMSLLQKNIQISGNACVWLASFLGGMYNVDLQLFFLVTAGQEGQ